MKLDPEGVEKAAQAVCRQAGDDAAELGVFHHELATAALTAYFDHLKSEGLMRDSVAYRSGDTWDANTNYAGTGGKHNDFPALIIRTDKD